MRGGFVAVGLVVLGIGIFGCGSADDNHEFGVTDDLQANQDQFPTGPSGLSSDADPIVTPGSDSAADAESVSADNSTGAASTHETSSELIDDFLWKPISESTGNLAVLVNPRNVRVEVSGDRSDTLGNTGPSNGRGTTARGPRPGCDYGDNVVVEFFDSSNRRIFVADGRSRVIISKGCERHEFKL